MAPFFISRNNILLNPKSYSDFNNLSRILFTLFKYAKNIHLVGVAGLEPATSASRTLFNACVLNCANLWQVEQFGDTEELDFEEVSRCSECGTEFNVELALRELED